MRLNAIAFTLTFAKLNTVIVFQTVPDNIISWKYDHFKLTTNTLLFMDQTEQSQRSV